MLQGRLRGRYQGGHGDQGPRRRPSEPQNPVGILRKFEEVPGSPGKSRKEGQEEQRTLKQLGGVSLALLPLPGLVGLPFGSSLGSLELPLKPPWDELCLEGLKNGVMVTQRTV